jgi:hypothetical protein
MLTPPEFKRYTDEVLEMGAAKYGPDNWQAGHPFTSKMNKLSIIGHVLRNEGVSEHEIDLCLTYIRSYISATDNRMKGKGKDKESGLYHLQHAMTRCGIELYRIEHSIGEWGDE